MRIAVLTPSPTDPHYANRWSGLFEGYHRLFAALGIEVVPAPWTEGPPKGADAVVPMLAWGYHLDIGRWRALLQGWPAALPLVNSPAVLQWNSAKTYLVELGKAGVPVVPTQMVELADAQTVAAAFDALGAEELVVKPQISAGAHRTARIRRGDPFPEPLAGAMIQPFLPAVAEEGELSLFYFGGRFSHAVRKVAKAGDFRVQPQYGAALGLFDPDAEALGVAERALKAAPAALAYARVDMVRGPGDRLQLMELEAIEPDLYLDLAPDGGTAFGRAIIAALKPA